MSGARRRKGEGSIARKHNHPTCPPVGPDGERPDHKCQGPYRAQVWVNASTGERVRKTVYGKTEREVMGKLKKLNAADVAGTVVARYTTVKDWLDPDSSGVNFWTLNVEEWKVNTRSGYRSKIERYLIPHLGHHRLDKLTPDHVDAMYRAMRKQGLAEKTLRQTHAVLSRSLKVAMWRGKVTRNVCDFVKPPSVKARTKRAALTVEDAWKVLRAAGDNPRFWVALMCGVRQGEALALRWSDVHLDAVDEEGDPSPYLITREALSREPGVGLVFDTPKSEESTDRVVPLVTPVAARLAVARANHLAAGGTEDDLVFPNPRTGNPKDSKRDWTEWSTLLTVAGVGHVPLHAARNTTAHLLEDAGVPDRVVAEILGHSTVQMTHHYQSGNLAAKRTAMKALEGYMAAKDPGAA